MIGDLKPPLGVSKKHQSTQVMNFFMKELKVPLWKHKETKELAMTMYDVILALSRNALSNEKEFEE